MEDNILMQYVAWAKEFNITEEGVDAFRAIYRVNKIRDLLMSDAVDDAPDALSQIRLIVQ
ncbi:hypothetical protein ISF9_112 [Microbacterium phage vB_MoxS-ISF9]|uniref:Uncharacterized protein n=1 Tax=Microbacterium phage vB_MoxS-ISF9 TaxID=1458670 RepID=W8P0E1_9CAUD|nr:hypothetical protein ISF9_112 [Microbacterium phage vB_MoxS-ISF9]AHL18582.1 hypothetical protein ISF9_112 [Microbacterium phage vB_MoxS-ISF9]